MQNAKRNKEMMLIADEAKRLTSLGIPVIVEGKKDKASLEAIGITNIITLNKPLYAVIESITLKDAAILTDMDERGRKLYQELKSKLSSRGVRIDDRLRRLLYRARIMHVESLHGIMETWKSQEE